MPPIIYVTGYSRHSLADLAAIAEHLDAYVVDVRWTPWSRRPEWQQQAMGRALRSRYVHIKTWGNPNHGTDRPIIIDDFWGGWEIVKSLAKPVILLCWCPVFSECHRSHLAERITSNHLAPVAELDWDCAKGQDTLFTDHLSHATQ
jgi:hypothetical protein